MLSNVNPLINPSDQTIRRIAALENEFNNLNVSLTGTFLSGRLRTDRVAPISSSDVQTPDELYDRVLTANYEYILIQNSGSLSWRRVALSSF